MFMCWNSFLGGSLACAVTPTNVDNINYVELKNGMYDALYVSKNTDFEITSQIPDEWDIDTILYAKLDSGVSAGNVDWSIENTSHIVLKRRIDGDFKWKTIAVKETKTPDDFKISYPDYFVASGQTIEYAIVNVFYGLEGSYTTTKVTPKFSKLFLIEDEIVWGTDITDGYCNTTRNIPSSNVELLNSKYPIFVRNGMANYDTGTCSGGFVPFIENSGCLLAYGTEHDYSRVKYQRDFMDFICDGVPKILKLPDGRMWVVQVTPNPTDSAKERYNDREISFSWVEIGDANSEEDMYYLGLSDVSPEWWNK